MTKKKSADEVETIKGYGIKTSGGVVLLSCTLTCRVCGTEDLFEWPEKNVCSEDLEGIDTLAMVIAVAHSKNWIAQNVINTHEGKRSLFVLCPACLALFFSATSASRTEDKKNPQTHKK